MKFDPCHCTPESVLALATTVSIALSEGLSPDEAAALGTLFSVIGDQLSYISAHRSLCENSKQSYNDDDKNSKE